MANELLQASDLEAAKKHDTFHSEVITGKAGGVAGGVNIEYATNDVTGQVQKTLPEVVDGIDWTPVGKFVDGVTFTKQTDYAVDAAGTQWSWLGGFPYSAPAGTVPLSPDYMVVHVGSHSALTGTSESDQHPVRSISGAVIPFDTVAEMVSGTGLPYTAGMRLKVQGEGGNFTNYIVVNTASDVDLGGGLWAKELVDFTSRSRSFLTTQGARQASKFIDGCAVSITAPENELSEGFFYYDPLDTTSQDDDGITTIVTDRGERLKLWNRPVTSSVLAGTSDDKFDDNEISDSIYGAFVKSGVSMSAFGRQPQVVSNSGTANAEYSQVDYTFDFIHYLKATATSGGVSSVRLGESSEGLTDVIEVSFNFNHVTGLAENGTISVNFFNLIKRVLYTGTQTCDLAIAYDSKAKAFYMLNRGTFNIYTQIADRAEFASVGRTFEHISYTNDALASISVDHNKVCRPNYIAIGDSICAGANYFSPNPAFNLNDYSHQWEAHCNMLGINTVIMNRGVGGERSNQISSRIAAEVVANNPRQVYLHLSTNDAQSTPMTYADRTSFTQASIDSLSSAGIQTVLLNSVYSNLEPTWAAYYQDYLTDPDGFRNLKGYKTWVNQMDVLANAGTGVLDPAYTDPDGTHLNAAGYTLMGQTIAIATLTPTETVKTIDDNVKYNFPNGIQSFGKDISNKPTGWVIIEPVAGSFDYKVASGSEGAEKVVLGGTRDAASPSKISIITSDRDIVPSSISTYGDYSPTKAGTGLYNKTSALVGGDFVSYYFANLLYDTGTSAVKVPDETDMQAIAWYIKF